MIPGEIYTYTPASRWCRHGIAVVHADGRYAFDTYQGLNPFGTDFGCFNSEELLNLKDLKRVGNINEFHVSNNYEVVQYDKQDQFWIPMGTRSEMHFVRNGAKPVVPLQIEQQERIIDAARGDIRHAQWTITRAQEEIAKLQGGKDADAGR